MENKKIIIDKNLCPQNHACPAIKICSVGAISQTDYDLPVIDYDKCIRCGKCVNFCPMRAMSLI